MASVNIADKIISSESGADLITGKILDNSNENPSSSVQAEISSGNVSNYQLNSEGSDNESEVPSSTSHMQVQNGNLTTHVFEKKLDFHAPTLLGKLTGSGSRKSEANRWGSKPFNLAGSKRMQIIGDADKLALPQDQTNNPAKSSKDASKLLSVLNKFSMAKPTPSSKTTVQVAANPVTANQVREIFAEVLKAGSGYPSKQGTSPPRVSNSGLGTVSTSKINVTVASSKVLSQHAATMCHSSSRAASPVSPLDTKKAIGPLSLTSPKEGGSRDRLTVLSPPRPVEVQDSSSSQNAEGQKSPKHRSSVEPESPKRVASSKVQSPKAAPPLLSAPRSSTSAGNPTSPLNLKKSTRLHSPTASPKEGDSRARLTVLSPARPVEVQDLSSPPNSEGQKSPSHNSPVESKLSKASSSRSKALSPAASPASPVYKVGGPSGLLDVELGKPTSSPDAVMSVSVAKSSPSNSPQTSRKRADLTSTSLSVTTVVHNLRPSSPINPSASCKAGQASVALPASKVHNDESSGGPAKVSAEQATNSPAAVKASPSEIPLRPRSPTSPLRKEVTPPREHTAGNSTPPSVNLCASDEVGTIHTAGQAAQRPHMTYAEAVASPGQDSQQRQAEVSTKSTSDNRVQMGDARSQNSTPTPLQVQPTSSAAAESTRTEGAHTTPANLKTGVNKKAAAPVGNNNGQQLRRGESKKRTSDEEATISDGSRVGLSHKYRKSDRETEIGVKQILTPRSLLTQQLADPDGPPLLDHELRAVIVQLLERVNRLEQTASSAADRAYAMELHLESGEECWIQKSSKRVKRASAASLDTSNERTIQARGGEEAASRGVPQIEAPPADKGREAVRGKGKASKDDKSNGTKSTSSNTGPAAPLGTEVRGVAAPKASLAAVAKARGPRIVLTVQEKSHSALPGKGKSGEAQVASRSIRANATIGNSKIGITISPPMSAVLHSSSETGAAVKSVERLSPKQTASKINSVFSLNDTHSSASEASPAVSDCSPVLPSEQEDPSLDRLGALIQEITTSFNFDDIAKPVARDVRVALNELEHFNRNVRPLLGSAGLVPTIETDHGPLRGTDEAAPMGLDIWYVTSEYDDKEYKGQPEVKNIPACAHARAPLDPLDPAQLEWIQLFQLLPRESLIDWAVWVVRQERALWRVHHLDALSQDDVLRTVIDQTYTADLAADNLVPTERMHLHNRCPLVDTSVIDAARLTSRQITLLDRCVEHGNKHYALHAKHTTEVVAIMYLLHKIEELTVLRLEVQQDYPDVDMTGLVLDASKWKTALSARFYNVHRLLHDIRVRFKDLGGLIESSRVRDLKESESKPKLEAATKGRTAKTQEQRKRLRNGEPRSEPATTTELREDPAPSGSDRDSGVATVKEQQANLVHQGSPATIRLQTQHPLQILNIDVEASSSINEIQDTVRRELSNPELMVYIVSKPPMRVKSNSRSAVDFEVYRYERQAQFNPMEHSRELVEKEKAALLRSGAREVRVHIGNKTSVYAIRSTIHLAELCTRVGLDPRECSYSIGYDNHPPDYALIQDAWRDIDIHLKESSKGNRTVLCRTASPLEKLDLELEADLPIERLLLQLSAALNGERVFVVPKPLSVQPYDARPPDLWVHRLVEQKQYDPTRWGAEAVAQERILLTEQGHRDIKVRLAHMEKTLLVKPGMLLAELFAHLGLDPRHVTGSAGGKTYLAGQALDERWTVLTIEFKTIGGAIRFSSGGKGTPLAATKPNSNSPSKTPTGLCPNQPSPASVAFDKAFWPPVLSQLAGAAYDGMYFKECKFSHSIIAAIKDDLDLELHPLLEGIKETIARSSLNADSPLAQLFRAYESFHFEECVDHMVLLNFVCDHYGWLLVHDIEHREAAEDYYDIARGSTDLDLNPTYAFALVVSSIPYDIDRATLYAELGVALERYPVHWRRLKEDLDAAELVAIQPFGAQYSVLVPLTSLTPFFKNPVDAQLPDFGIVYGSRRPIPKSKGATYAIRFSVQYCTAYNIPAVQSARHIAALVWGSDNALSEQLQHQALSRYFGTRLSPSDQKRVLLITARAAASSRGAPTIRQAVSVLYRLHQGGDVDGDQRRISTTLALDKPNLVACGLTFGVVASPSSALLRRPACPSLTSHPVLVVSGLAETPQIGDVLRALAESGSLVLRGEAQVFSLYNRSARDKDLRYLIVIGQAAMGQLNLADPIFRGIATVGRIAYDIRIELVELKGQLELRNAHLGKALKPQSVTSTSAKKPSIPTAHTSTLVAAQNRPNAWDNAVERYSPGNTSLQSVTKLLAEHTEDIKRITKNLDGLAEQVNDQGKLLSNMVTLPQIKDIMQQVLDSAKADKS